jgi:CCR4-NOT transcription complex subunit 1
LRFEHLEAPPPRICKLVQQIYTDPDVLETILCYGDWLAIHLVTDVQDHPAHYEQVIGLCRCSSPLSKVVVQAAIWESLRLILSDKIGTYEGGFVRRKLTVMGKLIGALTFAVNRIIPARFLDLKHLLMSAFAQGKLFGVISFVAEIVRQATEYFNPPNPYMSSLLKIVASIGQVDLLKFYIKSQISEIMAKFNVHPCQMNLTSLVPELRDNSNFDFVAPPFSLHYILSGQDIDRVVQFDENVFTTIAAQNLAIGDPPVSSAALTTQLRDKMRTSVTHGAYSFLKKEGDNLSKTAASTTLELIQKDFVYCQNVDLMLETAAVLTQIGRAHV